MGASVDRQSRSQLRMLFSWVCLVGLLLLVGLQVFRLVEDRDLFPPRDFIEYWAAGRLTLAGENPYDAGLMLAMERTAQPEQGEAIMMWNPPWTLTYVLPYSLLEWRVGQLVWLFVQLGMVLGSVSWLWMVAGGNRRQWWVGLLLAGSFAPTYIVLLYGQISVLLLLGAVGFLACLKDERPYCAGVMTIFMAVKPHLFVLFWLSLGYWIVAKGKWRVLWGGVSIGLVTTLVPMLWNPSVVMQYVEELVHRPPSQWKTPTLGSLLRMMFGVEYFRLQFVGLFLGLLWLVWYGNRMRQHGGEWDWNVQLPRLMLVSYLLAPYGVWPFDLVALLCPVVMLATRLLHEGNRLRMRWAVCAYVVINLVAFAINLIEVSAFWYVWMAPSLLILYFLLESSLDSKRALQENKRPPVLVGHLNRDDDPVSHESGASVSVTPGAGKC